MQTVQKASRKRRAADQKKRRCLRQEGYRKMESEKKKKISLILLLLFLLIIITGLCAYIFLSGRKQEIAETDMKTVQKVAANQGTYIEPEEPVDRSKNVTLPGWVSFTIPANTTEITEGFEFHNPGENFWYEDVISIEGTELENLVVDSGIAAELNHYLGLAGINETVTKVTDYDSECFTIAKSDEGSYTVEATAGFEGTKTITVSTDQGREVDIDVTCSEDFYYMSFGLYLTENDELLYQSDLVSPGNYIQSMELSRVLEPGSYDAYVVCQPYRSDQVTQTNQGVVKITLNVK